MNDSLPEMVVGWRTAQQLTQDEAAARLGTTQATISRIESGTMFPGRETARMLIAGGVFTAEQFGRAAAAPLRAA